MRSLKDELISRLERIPGISHVPFPDRSDGFSGLRYRGREIGHFHHFNELDLKLGRKLIRQQGLKHQPDSEIHPKRGPGSQYIELRFHRREDVDEIVRLVELLAAELSK